ncbi:MAG TPA: hypothetical protein VN873_16920 [Candidatus Angelobacter sp.]|nr:hypothetical protein [Candidatus Angelobacter sp.]
MKIFKNKRDQKILIIALAISAILGLLLGIISCVFGWGYRRDSKSASTLESKAPVAQAAQPAVPQVANLRERHKPSCSNHP